jgi:hypothetical protein
MSVAHFCLGTRDGRPVPRATPVPVAALTEQKALGAGDRRSSLPTWVGHSLALLRTSSKGAVTHLALSPPPFGHAPRCSVPRRPLHHRHCPSPMRHPELSDRTKRSALSPHPSCTKRLPAAPASEAGPWDFLTIIFPHPNDPAASFAPPWSSSLTSSSATLTTLSAPHPRFLLVGARATAEAPPPDEHPLPDLPFKVFF